MRLRLVGLASVVALCTGGAAYASFDQIPPGDWPQGFEPEGATLQGDESDDRFGGTDKADFVRGGLGADTLRGAGGSDQLEGQSGADNIFGGGGDDGPVEKAKGKLGYCLYGGAGRDHVSGGIGSDHVVGQRGADVVVGGPQDDAVLGGPGDDEVKGGGGMDILRGGDGDDSLFDLERSNIIKCGPGVDHVTTNSQSRVGEGCEVVTIL